MITDPQGNPVFGFGGKTGFACAHDIISKGDAMPQNLGTIMIVDDDDIDQRANVRTLTRAGFSGDILQFHYADHALAHLEAHPETRIDWTFLDINMPRLDGFEFLEAVQKTIPAAVLGNVIMLSSSANPEDSERAIAYDAVRAVYTKPLQPNDLDEIREMSAKDL